MCLLEMGSLVQYPRVGDRLRHLAARRCRAWMRICPSRSRREVRVGKGQRTRGSRPRDRNRNLCRGLKRGGGGKEARVRDGSLMLGLSGFARRWCICGLRCRCSGARVGCSVVSKELTER